MRFLSYRLRALGLAVSLIAIVAIGLAAQPWTAEGGQGSWSRLDLNALQINAIAVDPSNANQLFAGTAGQGVFRSADGGQTWAQINNGLANLFVNDILIDPTNTANLLAGTGRGPLVGEPTAGIYRSTDRGNSWTRVQATGATEAFALTPQAPNVIYAAGGPPVFKSVDGGATWATSFQPNTDIVNVSLQGISVDPADPNIVLAAGNTEGGQGQVFRSVNAGSTWDRVLAGQAPIQDLKFATDLRFGVLAFFGNMNGVFRSTDAGLTWQQTTTALGTIAVRKVQPNPLNAGEVAAATGSGVIRSVDTGLTWSKLDSTLGNMSVRTVVFNTVSPQTLFAGTDDGVWAFTFTPAPTPTPVTPTPVTPTPTPTPTAAATSFFAEGSTQDPFQTWFLIQNPTGNVANVHFTFEMEGGSVQTRDITVGPHSRFSLFMNPILPGVAFSTRIEADQKIFTERSMFVSFDGDDITGIASPAKSWMFAEGTTQAPFQTWVLVQNPNSVPANTTITYLLPDRPPVVQALGALAPTSRTSVFVNQVLPNEAFSIRVDSDQPVIAERALYRFPGNAATDTAGATDASRTWFFAEGSSLQSGTPSPFDTFLLLQNPQQVASTATITLFDESGNQTPLQVGLGPMSRTTIFLNQLLPNKSFGIRVDSTQPIVVERSQFFGPEPRGATGSLGAPALATTWNLPEGSTQPPFTEVIAILNPNSVGMSAHIDFELENGQVIGRDFTVGPTSKLTIRVNDLIPNNALSAMVTTSMPSVVERTMFFQKLGSTGGTNAVGIPQ